MIDTDNTDDTDDTSKLGHIDLVRLFETEADQLIAAAHRGAVLHGTKNIRESGGHIEHELRRLLGRMLPAQFRVLQGYYFDIDSNCTPQIDAMIVNSAECHEIMQSAEGSSYVPITSALAIFEVKNSPYSISANFKQLAKRIRAITDMRARVFNSFPQLETPPPLLSVMLFATSEHCDLKDVQAWYKSTTVRPTYTIFLDKGILIAEISALHRYVDIEPASQLGNDDHEFPGDVYLCTPTQTDFKKGRLWLWIYFSLAAYLHKSEGKQRGILAFTKKAVDAYEMKSVIRLDEAADWEGKHQLSALQNPETIEDPFKDPSDKHPKGPVPTL